ncbi:MAG TPA: beta-L-arabinofuranosidase domain-containing protein, partial [bacterium]|nr:beta-L-arabinofuranosidase domain-containing protein [bacterium]
PLAYLLNDDELKARVMPWIEWTLTHQAESGYFGPVPFEEEPEAEPGIQKTPRRDWWPKMVMLKVLQQYYSATGDERVIDLMLNYFRYQLEELPETPLDHWSFWANRRGGDNLVVVYWLYNITGEQFLLDLAELLHEQTFPYTTVFLNEECYEGPDVSHLYPYNTGNRYPFDMDLINRLCIRQLMSFHCVNIAQGIKEPVIYYQQHPDSVYLRAVKKALHDLRVFHGQPQGMYGGDEALHGRTPTQGIEFCSVVEFMFSLENILSITGDMEMADHLERIAYNALPTQARDDFSGRQYFQSANQVEISRNRRNFYVGHYHGGTDLCYGVFTGYPCCTTNMHQGWPKFTRHLWFATPDNGLAALVYAPSRVTALVGDNVRITLREETAYPFENTIRFILETDQSATFPLHLRVPGWCEAPEVRINGQERFGEQSNQTLIIDRTWEDGDKVELILPMEIRFSRWAENSVAVERGPLVYALKIREAWKQVDSDDQWGDYEEVYSRDPWNYGLLEAAIADPEAEFEVITRERISAPPWNLENAPVTLRAKGKRIPEWQLYNHMAGPLPHSRPQLHLTDVEPEEITLIPYGCTTLRITEFPVVR